MTAILTLNKPTFLDRMLFWAPRMLCIAQVVFISLFALDAWSGDAGFWHKLAAFGIHLIPTAGLVVALVIAWRWPMTGGFMLVIMGTIAALLLDNANWATPVFITLPVFVIGLLFLADGLHRQVPLGPTAR